MDEIEYERILKSIESAHMPSQLDNILNWIENYEQVFGNKRALELRELTIEKINTFE